MNPIVFYILIVVVVCVVLTVLNLYFYTDICKGESLPAKQFTPKLDWMKRFANKNISELYIPGTHDSSAYQTYLPESVSNYKGLAARLVSQFTITQKLTIYDQLRFGVRVLDFRVNTAIPNEPWLSHTAFTIKLEDALQQISKFSKENPSEVVVILLNEDWEFRNYITRWGEVGVLLDKYFINMTVPQDLKSRSIGELTSQGKKIIIANLKKNVQIPTKVDLWDGSLVDFRWYDSNDVQTVLKGLFDDISKPKNGRYLNVSGPIVTPDLSNDILPAINPFTMGCKWSSLERMAQVANKTYLESDTKHGNYKIRLFDFIEEDILLDVIGQNI